MKLEEIEAIKARLEHLGPTFADSEALLQHVEELRGALTQLAGVIEAAGLHNLTNGVQLGPTVWFVKASDAMDRARRALGETPT